MCGRRISWRRTRPTKGDAPREKKINSLTPKPDSPGGGGYKQTLPLRRERKGSLGTSMPQNHSRVLQPAVMLFFFGSIVFRSPSFSDMLILYSSLSVKEKILDPRKSINKNTEPYVLIFTFRDSKQKDKRFYTESNQTFTDEKINCVAKYWIPYCYLLTYIHTYLLTHSMEQSPSSEANWFCS